MQQRHRILNSCDVKKCKAWCCRFIVVEYQPMTGLEDDMLFFALRGIKLDRSNMKLLIPCRCNWLRSDYRCKIYSQRPKSCKEFRCEGLKGNEPISSL
jgi:Fe-S-cluster containining protein